MTGMHPSRAESKKPRRVRVSPVAVSSQSGWLQLGDRRHWLKKEPLTLDTKDTPAHLLVHLVPLVSVVVRGSAENVNVVRARKPSLVPHIVSTK